MAYPSIHYEYQQLKYNVTYKPGRKVQYIVIHYTGGTGSAKNNCIYFGGGDRQASADYFVDKDGSIWKFNGNCRDYYSWHCGDGHGAYGISNANSIGIECVSNGEDFTSAQIDGLRSLVLAIMEDYGISAGYVVRHYDASRKECPAPYIDWTKWSKLRSYITTKPNPVKYCIIYQSNGQANQKWKLEPQSDGSVIIASKTGLVLDVAEGKAKNGAYVIAYKRNGGKNQKWFIEGDRIRSALGNFYLDVYKASDNPGTYLEIYEPNDSDAQKWAFLEGADGWTTILNNHTYRKNALDIKGGA